MSTAKQSNISARPTAKSGRPPVVVVLGHIDHGKSTLLDFIRQSKVAEGEAGGITQAVNAYLADGITFVDTPGHEAFSQMRESGARLADIAILIISAEDGVKPQTIEALKAIREAELPYVVAINKIDRPNANADRVRQELAEQEVLVEDYGGKISALEVSAKTGKGIPELLELIRLMAELEELKGDPKKPARGFVLESNRDSKIGISATLIIKDGTLKQGDFMITGEEATKIKILRDFVGQPAKSLGPGMPAQAIGFTEMPEAGAEFLCFSSKKEAEVELENRTKITTNPKEIGVTGESADPKRSTLPIVLKSNTVGGLEALKKEVLKLGTERLGLKLLQTSVGTITENDIKLTASKNTGDEAARAVILGFNVTADQTARDLAERTGVTIQTFDIIYKLSEWLEEEIKKQTPKEEMEEMLGLAKVLKIFSESKGKQVIGGTVTEGNIRIGKKFKIMRRGSEIGRGKIVELRQQRLPAKEVAKNAQFGALAEARISIAPGDILEAFDLVIK